MTRPRLSVSAAVEAFEVERRTLQRLLATGQLDGAAKDERGRWLIPVESLHAAGFGARQTWLSDATSDATRRDSDATELQQRVTQLEQQIAHERQRAETEMRLREAAERNADDLRSSLRMLEVGHAPPAGRRWWQRR